MAKQVIVVKSSLRVFNTLEEAARELDIAPGSISRAIMECRECKGHLMRYAPRVYAVKLKGTLEWVVATRNARNSGYLGVDDPMRKIGLRMVDRVKDITPVWYYWREEW